MTWFTQRVKLEGFETFSLFLCVVGSGVAYVRPAAAQSTMNCDSIVRAADAVSPAPPWKPGDRIMDTTRIDSTYRLVDTARYEAYLAYLKCRARQDSIDQKKVAQYMREQRTYGVGTGSIVLGLLLYQQTKPKTAAHVVGTAMMIVGAVIGWLGLPSH